MENLEAIFSCSITVLFRGEACAPARRRGRAHRAAVCHRRPSLARTMRAFRPRTNQQAAPPRRSFRKHGQCLLTTGSYALRSYSIDRQGWLWASALLPWATRLVPTAARRKAIVLGMSHRNRQQCTSRLSSPEEELAAALTPFPASGPDVQHRARPPC